MFPIPFNFPFRKKDGSLTTIGTEISEGGGGGGYTLPTASGETKGGIKVGSGLSMSGEVLNNSNPTPYSLPTASDETLGGIKVGTNLSIDENGVLSATGGSGGSSLHLYKIEGYSGSSSFKFSEAFILTTFNETITTFNLLTALQTGIGFITGGARNNLVLSYLTANDETHIGLYYELTSASNNNMYGKEPCSVGEIGVSTCTKLF